jgi:hypothetical protein
MVKTRGYDNCKLGGVPEGLRFVGLVGNLVAAAGLR